LKPNTNIWDIFVQAMAAVEEAEVAQAILQLNPHHNPNPNQLAI
jgi:hypothetical protein